MMFAALPLPLLALSLFSFPLITAQTTLSPNTIQTFTLFSNSTSPLTISLPTTTSNDFLTVSIALCTDTQPLPKFFLSNSSDPNSPSSQLSIHQGVGTWTGGTSTGGRIIVFLGDTVPNGALWNFELAASTAAPLHRNLPDLPLLGDTTATQAILFSPAFSQIPHVAPSYPNYTLPSVNLSDSFPPPPASARTNTSLILAPTSQLQQRLDTNMTLSACAIRTAAGAINGSWISTNGTGGVNGSTSLVLRDYQGWRSQWFIEGLVPSTNYTAYVIQDGGAVSGPIYALTKSPSFPCPLVHSLPYCPLVSYAVPLPPPPPGTTSYTDSTLPQNVSSPLVSSLSNFTTSLLTFPCGRDVYSPLQTCENCADAYSAWACYVSFPRCAEQPSSSSSSSPHSPAFLAHPPAPPRSTNLPDISNSTPYNELLPCIETCQRVDRACPPMLSWTCPLSEVNANWTYGVGYVDGWEGTQGRGKPGVAQDRWGFVWCNG